MTATRANPEENWFGYTRTKPGRKTASVGRVFDSVANRYDLMNDLMSGGLHRLWKNRFAAMIRPRAGQSILDVAGGTGDIALRLAQRSHGHAAITVCDINETMLNVGRDKALDHGWLKEISWRQGNAEKLPFKDRSFDTVCIAFGLRNVTRIDTALTEFARVLKPGGRFFCMEFSPEVAPILKKAYDLYSFSVLPWLGEVVASDREAYQYLAESIRQFPDRQTLAKRMKRAGLENISWRDMTGGIVAVHSGWRL